MKVQGAPGEAEVTIWVIAVRLDENCNVFVCLGSNDSQVVLAFTSWNLYLSLCNINHSLLLPGGYCYTHMTTVCPAVCLFPLLLLSTFLSNFSALGLHLLCPHNRETDFNLLF